MIKRIISTELLQAAREYPIVTVVGPRQSGKTTLVRMVFPNKPYFSLEDPDTRMAAENDPRGFSRQMTDGTVLFDGKKPLVFQDIDVFNPVDDDNLWRRLTVQ